MKTIDVLLATFNGEKHLKEQLESLGKQREDQFKLLVRDDGSTDWTKNLLKGHELTPPFERIGVVASFSELLKRSTADYTFFCDQDDVWLPNKIEDSLKLLQEEEKKSQGAPLLLHTDLKVVNEELEEIAPSFWSYAGLKPVKNSVFNRILIQNTVTGCTMVMNRALREKIGSFPEEAIMHDWWAALVASAFGKVISLPKATLLYRQHSRNALGAQQHSLSKLLKKGKEYMASPEKYISAQNARARQAEAFYQRYKIELSEEKKTILEDLPKDSLKDEF